MPRDFGTPLDRFRRKYRVVADTGCWEWTGCRDGAPRNGSDPRGSYGRFALDGYHMMPAHRASYELFRGPIPDGMFVCHHCDNPPCVNPAHLFLGTAQDNADDTVRKGRSWHQRGDNWSPRLGTGVGHKVPGKGTCVDAICAMCSAPMVQRTEANRRGETPVCSPACKAAFNSARQRTRIAVPCAECGTVVERKPSLLKRHKQVFCSRRCLGKSVARAKWS